ncbi:MAG: IS1182 family transposase [Bacteroidetes bacterium]|nr:MAG: IS1182 family transposase [Bacteroidota bacterium]
MQGKKQYSEKLFSNFQLSERVPIDNFYRRLKQELDLDFLYKETSNYYGTEGQQSIDPVVFFKLILVGYLENLNSDRKIIAHCSMRLDMLYFIGYDIDEELPWHSTLSRTRSLYGEEIFRSLFKKVLSLCVSKNMVGGKRQAIDSAFVKANASMDSLVEKEILEDGNEFADELDKNDDSAYSVSSRKKKEVEQHHRWKEKEYKDQPGGSGKARREKDEFGNEIRPKYLSNHTHYSKTDPDARISVKPGKPRQLNYSAQTSVDTRSHVITNIMADYCDKRDSQSLPEAVSQTIVNLEEHGLRVEEILADTGYSSGKSLRYLKEKNLTGYIPNFGQYKHEREGFIYNKEKDQYECQRGNRAILPLKKTGPNSKGYVMKVYRSSETVCKNCPLRTNCIGEKTKFKKIDDSIDKPLYDEMHARLQTAKAKRLKKQRSSTVEPVLGTLINFLAMRRIWTRGIENARKFMIGAAIAYNLKKWMNRKANTTRILPMSVIEGQNAVRIYFFRFLKSATLYLSGSLRKDNITL